MDILHRELRQRIHYIYSIFLSVSIIIAGLCLMAACLLILRSDSPFSRETVAATFLQIAFPVYLCIASVIGSIVLQIAFPDMRKKDMPQKQYPMLLRRLRSAYDFENADTVLLQAVRSERRIRRIYRILRIVFFAIGAAVFLLYACDPTHYHSVNINASIMQAMIIMIPCFGIPFAYSIYSEFLCTKSMRREYHAITQAISDGCAKSNNREQTKNESYKLWICRTIFLLVGICIMLYGMWAGGTMDVLTKAINICTECIGLG